MQMKAKGIPELQKSLKQKSMRVNNPHPVLRTAAGMLERRYQTKWFDSTPLTMRGGGPEGDKWRALKSESYIKRKRKKGKTSKLIYDGNLRSSYYARATRKTIETGVRDPDKKKLRNLTRLGFTLMTLEKSMRKEINEMVRHYIRKGKI